MLTHLAFKTKSLGSVEPSTETLCGLARTSDEYRTLALYDRSYPFNRKQDGDDICPTCEKIALCKP
jgi:hypothetical protein